LWDSNPYIVGHNSVKSNYFFNPNPNIFYKIVSVKDATKCLTVKKGGQHALKIDDYKGKENQIFRIFIINGKYVINTEGWALHIKNENHSDGGIIIPD